MDNQLKDSKFEQCVRTVIKIWNKDEQLDFLKVYPTFKLKNGLMQIWLSVYNEILESQKRQQYLRILIIRKD